MTSLQVSSTHAGGISFLAGCMLTCNEEKADFVLSDDEPEMLTRFSLSRDSLELTRGRGTCRTEDVCGTRLGMAMAATCAGPDKCMSCTTAFPSILLFPLVLHACMHANAHRPTAVLVGYETGDVLLWDLAGLARACACMHAFHT